MDYVGSTLQSPPFFIGQTGQTCVIYILGCVRFGATTPNIVAPTMLGVVACVLAVVCKRMQQLPTRLGRAVHHRKDTTHKSL